MTRKYVRKSAKAAAKPARIPDAVRRAYPFESAWIRRTFCRDLEDLIAITDGLPPSMKNADDLLDLELEGNYLDGGSTDDYILVIGRRGEPLDSPDMVARVRLSSVLALARLAVIPEYPRKSRKEAAA